MALYEALATRMKEMADALKLDGHSRRGLSESVGQSHDWINTIIHGRSLDPGAISVAKLCEAHGFNVRWLLTGLGPKLVDRLEDERAARERGEPKPPPRGTTADENAQRLLERGPRKRT